ncbi:transglutaminase domain-containing protein [Caproiciproducens galactitolivorans]|uniref:Transglutaminase-like domain-containing protein n=1 Tax=Caproiciproducens galactitolivorans TaxID=642589 RepID=A0A4Z0XWU4_9FIRM|nr:transglutaminase domain-containing protein [Caproiciproducens galactitolivorans]TGJ75939.1 hypothetical protein CAGA_19140 [Caproiciproducens galactitolivorans]
MKFISQKRIRSVVAGVLAAAMMTLPLSGCGQIQNININSALGSEVSSQAAASVVNSKSSVASKAPEAVQKAAVKASSKEVFGNSSIKKIKEDSAAQNSTHLNVIRTVAQAQSGYTHIDQREGYNYLPDIASRNVYKQIFQSVYKIAVKATAEGYYPTQKIFVSGTQLSEAQLRIILLAFLNDNPQIFWLANAYSYSYGSGGTYIQLYSVAPQSTCNTMIQKMNQKISEIIKGMPSGLNEFDRELYLFKYIADHCTYNNDAVTNNNIWQAFSAYGVLIDGKAVCEGYSRAMQLLCSYAGLQCMLLTGQSNNVNHMWNVIKINGNWYHLDITWSDSSTLVYNYFNINDAVVTKTHTIFPSASTLTDAQIEGKITGKAAECNLTVPVCTATADNYFKVKGIKVGNLDSADDNAAIAAFTSAIQSKSASVSFYVDDSVDYDQTLAKLVTVSPYKIQNWVLDANTNSTGSKINTNNLKYLTDKDNRGLTIFLSYQ